MATTNKINTRIILKNDDAAKWEKSTLELKKGEVALSKQDNGTYTIKVGTGETGEAGQYKNAAKLNPGLSTYITDDIKKLSANTYLDGDIAIVSALIATGSDGENKVSKTAYQWNSAINTSGDWVALDGNYDASNVYLDADISCAGNYTSIGNINRANTVLSAGTSLQSILEEMFSKELQPGNPTQPKVTLTVASGAKEVGTIVELGYSASLSKGSYTYGPTDTGVSASSWEVYDNTTTQTKFTTASGTFPTLSVQVDTDYTITAKATHNEGVTPLTNLGKPSTGTKIAAGTKSATANITGYYKWYYGYKAGGSTITIDSIDAKTIKALNGVKKSEFPKSLDATNMQQMFFCAPAGEITSVTVLDKANIPQDVAKLTTTVAVGGVEDRYPTAYDVWYVNNASAANGANKYSITING